jgi:hypothetical protein
MAKALEEPIVLFFSFLYSTAHFLHGSTRIDYFVELAGFIDDGRTAAALNHQLRPIKKEAQKMRAARGTNPRSLLEFCSPSFTPMRYCFPR